MATRVTYCRICEAGCGLLAEVEGERLVSLRPDPDHVVSRGFACAKGTRFAAVHASPERPSTPLVKRGLRLEPASWEDALAHAAQAIGRVRSEHGPHSVAVYMGNPGAFSYTTPLFTQALVRALGTRNFFTASSLDCNNKFAVSARMLGSPMTHPVPDLDRARFALLVGTNPAVSQSSFVHAPRMVERLAEIERRGGRVVVVDPRRTETARRVGEHLPIVPDTDSAFLLALLHVVFDEGLEDRAALRDHAAGAEPLRALVRRFSPERVEGATGVAPARIRDIARAFAGSGGAFCHVSTGVNHGTFGSIAYAAKLALELCTGNLDRVGGALVPRGAVDIARVAGLLGFDREPRFSSRIGGFSPVMGALPTGIMADEILEPGPERVRALIVVAGNPLLSAPDGDRLKRALTSLDALVCLDLFVSDTAAHATHVLPCTDFLERDDFPLAFSQMQPVPFAQWTDAVVPPTGERRPEWEIIADLCREARLPLGGNRLTDAVIRGALRAGGPQQLLAPLLVPRFGLRPIRALRAHPHGLKLDQPPAGDFLKRRIGTPSGKVELFPSDVWARAPELERALDAPRGSTLRLITKREALSHNSWMHGNPRLAPRAHAAYLSPADAGRHGVAEGDWVRLTTATGCIELPAVVDPDVSPGVVAVPHGFGHDPESGWKVAVARGGANVNVLAPSGPRRLDPLSGMCQFVGVEVTLDRVAKARAAE